MWYITAIRMAGILLTLAASSALGVYLSNIYTFRRQDLLELKKALLILKSEIEYLAAPLTEAAANIAAKTTGPVSQLFANFAETLSHNTENETAYHLWLAAIEASKKDTFLNKEDIDTIAGFGKTLGYLDKQLQTEAIRLTISYIDAQITELQENSQKTSRMYKSLGVISGFLLLVIFW